MTRAKERFQDDVRLQDKRQTAMPPASDNADGDEVTFTGKPARCPAFTTFLAHTSKYSAVFALVIALLVSHQFVATSAQSIRTAMVFQEPNCGSCTTSAIDLLGRIGIQAEAGNLDDIAQALSSGNPPDLYVHPGGGDDTDADFAAWEGTPALSALRNYMQNKGLFLGICAGAYMAVGRRFGFVDVSDFSPVGGLAERTAKYVLQQGGEEFDAFFQGGPKLAEAAQLPGARIFGTMTDSAAQGEEPASVMLNGRIGLISLHWEFTNGDYATNHFRSFMKLFGGAGTGAGGSSAPPSQAASGALAQSAGADDQLLDGSEDQPNADAAADAGSEVDAGGAEAGAASADAAQDVASDGGDAAQDVASNGGDAAQDAANNGGDAGQDAANNEGENANGNAGGKKKCKKGRGKCKKGRRKCKKGRKGRKCRKRRRRRARN